MVPSTSLSPYVGALKINYLCKDLKRNVVCMEDLHQAYMDNLELSLQATQRLLPYLSGKVYITGDHGDALCEPDLPDGILYGHGYPNDIPQLRDVPWLKVKLK